MILPEEFNEKWDVKKDGPLLKYKHEDNNSGFSNNVKRFLTIGGLPETPAPFLDFTSSESTFNPITTVCPKVLIDIGFQGSTGSGDPICVVQEKENIVYLDNSNNYQEVFINFSINQFAESLLAYSKMIDRAIEENGEDAYIDNEIPESVKAWLKEELERIDTLCTEKGALWFTEIESLNEQKNNLFNVNAIDV